jgi:hypothetical protein
VGELTGSKYPNEIIVVGGHIDNWDVGSGAQGNTIYDTKMMLVEYLYVLRQSEY